MADLKESEIAVNQRFVEVYNRLKATYQVEGKMEFCVALGMPKANFSRIEKNQRSIPSIYLEELEQKFDVSMTYLVSGIGPMFKKESTSGQSFHNAGSIHGGQQMVGAGQQYSQAPVFTPQGLDLIAPLEKEIEGLKRSLEDKDKLLAEKEERIHTLNRMITMLENQLSNKQ